ncbi:MAG: archaeal proteasome endopeptidase complex subunit alpha [Candidatus Helarchaeota archaeon]
MMGLRDAGYDRTIMYSPDGRIIQVEYAKEAVRRGSSVIAIRSHEGIVILAESRSYSRLLEANEKIAQIDDNLCIAFSGLLADSKVLITEARVHAQIQKITYGEECDVESLATHLSKLAQHITQFGGRPFGLSIIIAGINNSKPELCVVEPSGAQHRAMAIAIGRNDNEFMSFLEENYTSDLSLADCRELAERTYLKVNQNKVAYELLQMDFNQQKIQRDLIIPNDT